MKIESWKENTLATAILREKYNTYPISKEDLLFFSFCPLCNSQNLAILTQVFLHNSLLFFETSVCGDCSFVFRTISPSYDWFKKCWNIIKSDTREVFNQDTENKRKQYYSHYYELLSPYLSKEKIILDIGAAYGTGANIFKEKGYYIETIEPEINKSLYIKEIYNIPVVGERIETFFLENRYDVIIAAHVLEHVDNPMTAIEKIYTALKPNGIAYIEVPTLPRLITWTDALLLTHKSNFSRKRIQSCLREMGFQIMQICTISPRYEYQCEFGAIIKKNNKKINYSFIAPRKEYIQKLYHKNFPLPDEIPPLSKPIIYNVSAIDHFFQTIRLNNYTMKKINDSYCFIKK